jgi:hypothetical protein
MNIAIKCSKQQEGAIIRNKVKTSLDQFNTLSNSRILIIPNTQFIQHNLKGIFFPYEYIELLFIFKR